MNNMDTKFNNKENLEKHNSMISKWLCNFHNSVAIQGQSTEAGIMNNMNTKFNNKENLEKHNSMTRSVFKWNLISLAIRTSET